MPAQPPPGRRASPFIVGDSQIVPNSHVNARMPKVLQPRTERAVGKSETIPATHIYPNKAQNAPSSDTKRQD